MLSRGLYDYPETNPRLGVVAPSVEAVAKALAANEKTKLQPSGAYAANLLGLSEQVPAKVVFMTNGRTRKVKIGMLTLELRSSTPKRPRPQDGQAASFSRPSLTWARNTPLPSELPIFERHCQLRIGSSSSQTSPMRRPGYTPISAR